MTLFIPRQVLLKNLTEVSLRHRHHVFYHVKSSVVLKDADITEIHIININIRYNRPM